MPKFIDCISEHYRNSGISSEWGITELKMIVLPPDANLINVAQFTVKEVS